MYLGVDYYPEQWEDRLLEDDLDTIRELGCDVIRIGEFSWHLMEKTEGAYDFSYFDRVIERAKKRDLHIVMGTPTATIPAWLAKKHPDILSEFEDGRKRSFGGRHVYCFNSPWLYEYSEKIIRQLVTHYRDEEAIVAWQLDNEIGHEDSDICYCPRCHKAFQDYLREKFQGDIEKLNETYGTTFWSQEYNDFDEIPLPVATITTHNPALRLDWERFRSKSIVDYMEFQAKLVKEIAPKAKVMHDFPGGGLNKHVDYSQVAEKVDITAYNNYPVWGGQKVPLKPHEIAFALDHIRGMKRGTFWITEAIMGAQGHDVTGFLPRPNQAKMWSYQAMAHGCSSLMYFRYRGASKGAEQFCYGILDADNVKRRKYYEVQDFFQTIRPYAEELEMPIRPQVAILYDYDSMAAFRIQRQSILLDCQREMQKVYRTFFDRNVPVDVIPARYDFSEYQVIVLPQMIIADPQVQERVKRFAEQGGTVVLTYRTAVKDTDNNIPFGQILPVGYQKFAGIQVVETESLQSEEAFPVEGTGAFAGSKGMGGIFRDMIQDEDAEVLYRYGDKFYTSFAAVTRKKCGKGMVYYLGCGLDKAITQKIFDTIMKEQKIDTIDSDPGVEVMIRGNKDKRIWMLINHNDYEARAGKVLLEPYSCKIVNFSFNP